MQCHGAVETLKAMGDQRPTFEGGGELEPFPAGLGGQLQESDLAFGVEGLAGLPLVGSGARALAEEANLFAQAEAVGSVGFSIGTGAYPLSLPLESRSARQHFGQGGGSLGLDTGADRDSGVPVQRRRHRVVDPFWCG